MHVKHLPSGLFPHFDSGFERRPLYPLAGETITIGCRLDEKEKQVNTVLHWKCCGETMPEIIPSDTRKNDNNQWYYTFIINLPDKPSTIEYWFTADDDNEKVGSKTYVFESLEEVLLEKPSTTIYKDKTIYALYDTEKGHYELKVEVDSNISIFFKNHLTVKVVEYKGFDELTYQISNGCTVRVENPFALIIENENQIIAKYKPIIKLLVDQHGQTYQIDQTINMVAEAFYGFGEKFDSVNQRGKSPLSYVVEQYSNQQDKTYIPIPFFFTNTNIGFYQSGSWKTLFSLQGHEDTNWNDVKLTARCPREGTLYVFTIFTGTPTEMIQEYSSLTVAPALPPKWSFGPWMSSNGWNTQAEALQQISEMKKLSIPATVLVLEAWSDEETFYIWNDSNYTLKDDGSPFSYDDFIFSEDGKWPDPKGFTDILSNEGVKLILWQIPVVKYEASNHGEQLDLDTQYAIDNKLCVQNADGSPYRISEMWFNNSLIPDFTNPNTVKWWFDKREYLLTELGVSGFKTDGGEFLFDETALLYDGRTIEEAHNEYPNIYVGAYHDFMNRILGENKGVTFSRAGYTGAGKYPIHWAGDQVSNFSELKAQLAAGLSIGLSGIPFWGFDIGGFAGEFPSTELYLRSSAFATFAPIMQFHSEPRYGQYYMTERNHWNNDRSPWNMAIANGDNRIIPVYRLFANIRMNLLPYMWKEANHCVEVSRPMMAHLIYDYWEEKKVLEIDDEYMLGRDLLVAPIVIEGVAERDIWLPPGNWYDLWTGLKMAGERTITYQCDLDEIPVFVREGAYLPLNINKDLVIGSKDIEGAISNNLDEYEVLSIADYGSSEITFKDDIGTDIKIKNIESCCMIDGTLPEQLVILPMSETAIVDFIVNGAPIKATKRVVTMFGRKIIGYQIL